MLRALELASFKAFSSKQRVRLAPITLVYGANSSGKTSILQSLLLMRQSIDATDDPTAALSPKGAFVDLGGYREFVHGHDIRRDSTIALEFDSGLLDDRNRQVRRYAEILKSAGHPRLEVTFGYGARSRAVTVKSIAIYVGAHPDPLVRFGADKRAKADAASMLGDGGVAGIAPETGVMVPHEVAWDHPYWRAVYDRYGHRDARQIRAALEALLSPGDVALDPRSAHRQPFAWYPTLANLPGGTRIARSPSGIGTFDLPSTESLTAQLKRYSVYTFRKAKEDYRAEVGAEAIRLRNYLPVTADATTPAEFRGYFVGRDRPVSMAGLAVFVGSLVREALSKLVYLGPLREYPERHYIFSGTRTGTVGKSGKLLPDVLFSNPALVVEINDELRSFGIGYDLDVSSLADNDPTLEDVFAVRLVDRKSGVNVSLRDVGFGISQVLPVIVQSMLSRDSLIAVEQPEIHLHPKLQGDLAELLVRCTRDERRNTFLIETHSEHIMLRIQRLIRTGQLDSSQVSVVYVDEGTDGADAVQLRLDSAGDFIDPWPNGFFEEGYREIFG